MGSPIPHVVIESGDVASAPPGAIPVAMFSDQASGGGETWQTLPGKPAVIAAGADQAAARTSIGAGTSNLAIGTTASTAKAGNYAPTYAEVTGKPASFPPAPHSATLVNVAANTESGIVAGTLEQVLIAQGLIIKDLNTRVLALENAP